MLMDRFNRIYSKQIMLLQKVRIYYFQSETNVQATNDITEIMNQLVLYIASISTVVLS